MNKFCSLVMLLLGFVHCCEASDLEVSVHFSKAVYHIGDQLQCIVQFTNHSARAIRFLPRDTIFPAGELHFESRDKAEAATLVRLADFSDIEALAKQVVTLDPGKTFVRALDAEVRPDFRQPYNDPRRGLILDFPGSALFLPGFGVYRVTKVFNERADDSVVRYLGKGPRFWAGSITSSPVNVEFRPK